MEVSVRATEGHKKEERKSFGGEKLINKTKEVENGEELRNGGNESKKKMVNLKDGDVKKRLGRDLKKRGGQREGVRLASLSVVTLERPGFPLWLCPSLTLPCSTSLHPKCQTTS